MGRALLSSLTPGQWERLKPMLDQALDMPNPQREAWLRTACGNDQDLWRRLNALLPDRTPAPDFLEKPVARLLETESEALTLGQRVGPYRVSRRLGHGGVGTVYLAHAASSDGKDLAEGRAVAIKVLRRGLDTEAVLRRFEQERQFLARLDHPGIVRLLGAGALDDGRPYLVLEFVEGEPIDLYCRQSDLDLPARLRLLIGVAQAVEAAHVVGIVHRDLKPSNILVTADGRPKLLDFGIARCLDPEAHLTRDLGPASSMLTPAYASPEQLLGGQAGPASDVYSLGALLWEMISGRPLHPAPETRRVRLLQSREVPPRLSTPSSSDPPWLATCSNALRQFLDAVLQRALAHRPEERQASAQELIHDLERILEGKPPANPPSRRPRTGRRAITRGLRRSNTASRSTRFPHGRLLLAVGAACFALGSLSQRHWTT